MPIAADFSVNVAGDIRHIANTNTYAVLELHRWLQDLADDAAAGGDDIIDITTTTPSERSTDNIIQLLGTFNIDDDAAEYFYDGSIKQGSGATEVIYSGLRILGAVNNSNTQLQVIQDFGLYNTDAPFWGDQSGGGLNGVAGAGILARFLVKSREFGSDIDGGRIVVFAREYGDSYDFFNVALGEGEAVAAIGTVPDPQNDTAQGTVTAYTHVTNIEGYQQIDIGDGNGDEPYYSKWTYGNDTSGDQKKGMWEFIKDLVGQGTAKTIHGMDGELFFGPTHSFVFQSGVGTFTEDEEVVWGTSVTYDALAGGNFTEGYYVKIGSLGAAGRIMWDDDAAIFVVALEDTSITLVDEDVITEYQHGEGNGATGVTALINVTIADNTLDGGSGTLLAYTGAGATGSLFIQKDTGLAPVDTLEIRGISSGATADVNGSVTPRTVPKTFLGSYTGALIGAYGVGIEPTDLLSTDSVEDLDGDTNTPPNNVTFTVTGMVAFEDYVLVGPKAGGNDFLFTQMNLASGLAGAGITLITVSGTIPTDTPASGTLRISLDDGRIRKQEFESYSGSDFTVASADYTDPDDAALGNGVMVSYLDLLTDATSEAFTVVFLATRTLWIRVRDGGGTPIKTFETQGTLGSSGGSSVASRITDE